MKTGYELVWLAAERTPQHLALVDDRTKRKLTYKELLREVDMVAAGLAARGVRAGNRIATILPNLFEHCIVLLALQRLAAVPALLNARLGVPELAELAAQSEVQGAVIRKDTALTDALAAVLPRQGVLLSVGGAIGHAADFDACRANPTGLAPFHQPRPEEMAFLFYTSGTTGLPKGVVIAHRTTEHRLVWLSTQAGLRHGTHTRTLGMVPISHAIGFYGTFLVTLAYNGTFYTMSAFNPVAANDLVERHRINYLFSVPTLYHAMISAPNYKPEKMASLQLVLYGGAPISPPLLDRIDREWPATVRHIYGTTEIMCALYHPEPVGQPVRLRPGYYSRVRVVQVGGNADDFVKPGESGELIVDASADTFFSGYLNQPEATAKKLRNGWYYTGDVCVLRKDGDVDLIGRVDDVIRCGGESVYPEEVEAVLANHPAIREAAVLGIPDPLWGEMVVACVVLNCAGVGWRDLDAHCRSSPLARFKRPRAYIPMESLPRNAANKVVRPALRKRLIQAREGGKEGELQLVVG
ncbi:MAG TPA: AMP-binding protein [Xanthobacteraceae bacterium]|jgi:acyl-CoA synthetase (AMP-forming)/AMP-acid ligase II